MGIKATDARAWVDIGTGFRGGADVFAPRRSLNCFGSSLDGLNSFLTTPFTQLVLCAIHMPRISPSLLRKAGACNPYLSSLLPVCRDLQSARNELRWLKEHATRNSLQQNDIKNTEFLLRRYVRRRARGEPLQYILGSEYFGDLEIQCAPGVLIPRSVHFFVSLVSCHPPV